MLYSKKNKNERLVTYKEIMNNCLCEPNQVEFLVIKALSLGLIKGYIDQVEEKVIVNWVQPKYLDSEKIEILHNRLDQWITKATKVLGVYQENCSPLLA